MSLAKVIEVIAEGDSIESAVGSAVDIANKTVRNVKHVNIDNIQAMVNDGKVDKYRVNAKVTFVIE